MRLWGGQVLGIRSSQPQRSINRLLKMAVLAGAQAVVHFHIRRGDDINALDDKGRSPLMLAASKGHTETCRILLDAGADPLVLDNEGNDVLSIALATGRFDLAVLLRERLAILQNLVHTQIEGQEMYILPEPQSNMDFDGASPCEENPDLSLWEKDTELPPPLAEQCFVAMASALQSGISAHIPIDNDVDWSDIDIELPNIQNSRKRKNNLDNHDRDAARWLFLAGLRDGYVSRQWVADVTYGVDSEPRDEFEMRLLFTLDDIGILVDDIDWGWQLSGDVETINDEWELMADDAVSFLSDLTQQENDPLSLYVKDVAALSSPSRAAKLRNFHENFDRKKTEKEDEL